MFVCCTGVMPSTPGGDRTSIRHCRLEHRLGPGCPNIDMRAFRVHGLLLVIGLSSGACILRPGMNSDCRWPAEAPRPLDLNNQADRRHLVLDAELVDELVDRYRFHVPNEQPACERRLADVVARTHSVTVADVAGARARVSDRGLNLLVNVPVTVLFVFTVVGMTRRIEHRFIDEPWLVKIGLLIASVAVAGLFVMVGEFWTNILQMIRVGSHHVGGRAAKLPWKQHEPQILFIGIAVFWMVVSLRRTLSRHRASNRHRSGGLAR